MLKISSCRIGTRVRSRSDRINEKMIDVSGVWHFKYEIGLNIAPQWLHLNH